MPTDSHEQVVIDAVPKGLFIGGEWRPAASGKTFPVEDPATGASLCDVADGDATDAIRDRDGRGEIEVGAAGEELDQVALVAPRLDRDRAIVERAPATQVAGIGEAADRLTGVGPGPFEALCAGHLRRARAGREQRPPPGG